MRRRGEFEQARIVLTRGVFVGEGDDAAEEIVRRWSEIADANGSVIPESSWVQGRAELEKSGLRVD